MANVVPGFVFTSSTPLTHTNLNLAAQPTVSIGSREVTNDNLDSANGLGYTAGVGGTVTQITSKATGVALNKPCGTVVTHDAALAGDTTVSFVMTNTNVAAGDVMVLNHVSGGTVGSYTLNAQCAAGSATINIHNVTTGSLGEALTIGFGLIKAVTS
jgi:hypothetical protein